MNPGLIPPADVAAAAKKGLELREKFHRGGTSVGVHRAQQLAERRDVSFRDITAISAYFARHEFDKASKDHEWGDETDPSAGYMGRRAWPPLGGQFEGSPEQDSGGIAAAASVPRDAFSDGSRLVILAQAGIQALRRPLDARFRGHDKMMASKLIEG